MKKETMELKEFLDGYAKNAPMRIYDVARKILELEAIDKYFQVMFGVKLEIKVTPQPRPEGRWLGKGIIEHLFDKDWKVSK